MSCIVRSLVACLVLGVLAANVAVLAQATERHKAAVVKVTAEVEGSRRTGTGFIVRLDRDVAYILTASHVVEGDNRPEIEFFTQRNATIEADTAHIEGGDPRGLALLIVRGKEKLPQGIAALPLAEGTDLRGGEAVTAIGFPQGAGPWAVVRATVASREGRDLTLDGNIDEGNSGGPILMQDAVVGVITSVDGKFARAVPAALVRLVLEGWGVPPLTAGDVQGSSQRPDRGEGVRAMRVLTGAARPADYSGACPVTIDFSWTISVLEGSGPLSYQIVRSDSAESRVETVTVDGPGAKQVSYSWRLGRADLSRTYTDWVALRIVRPRELESDKIHFTTRCEASTPVAPQEEASLNKLRASCEKLRSGTGYRIMFVGEAEAPAGAMLRTVLLYEGREGSRLKTSCRQWRDCQRKTSDPSKTAWSASIVTVGPAPTHAAVLVTPAANGAEQRPYSSKRVELNCLMP